MLPRKQRLSKDKEVTRVLRKGRAVFTNLLGVKVVPSHITHATVVVSTKVHKRAVKRNSIKRRIREALRVFIPQLKQKADIVVMAQGESVGRSQKDLATALEYSLKKLGIL